MAIILYLYLLQVGAEIKLFALTQGANIFLHTTASQNIFIL